MGQTFSHSPDDKINVVIGNGDDHIGHIVRGVQVAFHGGPEETNGWMSWGVNGEFANGVLMWKTFFVKSSEI